MVRAPTSAWLRWSSRVAAPEDAVRAAVEAVAIRELRLLARTPGGSVVAVSDTEASLRVVVVLRADGKGTEVVVLAGGQDVSSDLVRASLLAVPFVMCGIAGSYGESVAAAVLPLLFGGALLL